MIAPCFSDALTRRLSQVLYRCFEEVGSTKSALYLLDADEDAYLLVSHYGWPRLVEPPARILREDPVVLMLRRVRQSLLVGMRELESTALQELGLVGEMPRFMLSLIQDHGEILGLLVQRERSRREPFDVARDEAPTALICQAIAEVLQSYRSPARDGDMPQAAQPVNLTSAQSVAIHRLPGESLESVRATDGGGSALWLVPPECGDARTPTNEPPPAVQADPGETPLLAADMPPHSRQGAFPPEIRTFFWDAAQLLCSMMNLGAIALWSESQHGIRPLLAYSPHPLGASLKQQILGAAVFHLKNVQAEDLQIFSKIGAMEQEPAQNFFQTYLPVVLEQETEGTDLLLLFRAADRPFSEREQDFIRQVACLIEAHLHGMRSHEDYHHALLSVSHRFLMSATGGRPGLKPHCINTAKLAKSFAMHLDLPGTTVEAVHIAAILHDVGTFLLDTPVFTKQALDTEDMAKIRTHPTLASTFLKDCLLPFDVLTIIRHHHERWDGKGYPDGLKAEAIPVESRIIALAETYDVMTSGTEYSPARSADEALAEIQRELGAQFDPILGREFIEYVHARMK